MAYAYLLGEEWLVKNRQKIIRCPYQPGNLVISRKACLHRHRLAQKKKLSILKGADSFDYYRFRKGLSLCRICPIGKRLAYSLPMNSGASLVASRKGEGKTYA